MTTRRRTQKPLTKLGPAGDRLWRSVTTEFQLDEHELSLLLSAARCADVIERLDAEAAAQPILTENSRHDRQVNPAITEARQQRMVLARLIASLRLPSGEEAPGRPQRRGAARGSYGLRSVP